jgi:DNA replication protein DnaC
LNEQIIQHLQVLGLTYTAEHLQQHQAWAVEQRPAPSQWLERILSAEAAHKLQNRIERRIALCGLKDRKSLEAFDWNFQPALDKRLVLELGRMDFVRLREDLIITGKAGTGKSHIIKAFTMRSCRHHYSTRYARCVDLIQDLNAGLADGTYSKRLRKYCRPQLLVIDDVGLGHVKQRDNEPTAAHTLFNIIDQRHGRGSTALTSNIRLSRWGKYLGDQALAVAILDRLAMNAIRIDIDGPSYRQHTAHRRAKKRGTQPLDIADDGKSAGSTARRSRR